MRLDNAGSIAGDLGYRLRSMKNLIMQMKEDHVHCEELWKKLLAGTIERSEMEELTRAFSWLKEEIGVFLELRDESVEGVLWGEMDDIIRDVKEKERNLKILL